MLFKIQHGIIDISPDFIQPNDHRTRGSQRLRQLLILSSDHQRLEPAANSCHRPPDSSGIQGSPCQPVSTTPDAQLTPLLHVHSFILGTWVILSDFIGHRSFIQGNLQSEEDYYPYLGRRRRRGRQLVPDTDGTREEGVKMSVHCRPWDGISHVVTSRGSYWYKEWCDRDRDQLVFHSV